MASKNVPYVTLSNGVQMPIIGLGTFTSKPEDIEVALEAAIDCGYRMIDTAYAYENESAIGDTVRKLIQKNKIKREDLFIVTKLHGQFHKSEDVEPVLREALKNLKLDYVDAYLIHTPMAIKKKEGLLWPVGPNGKVEHEHVDHVETWRAMEKIYEKQLAKSIGLSNFNQKQIQNVIDHAIVKPQILQIEIHAYFPQFEMEEYCKKNGIALMAYGPIGSPNLPNVTRGREIIDFPILMDDPWVRSVAANYKKTPAQVLLRWLVQRGIVAIPKSTNPKRIQENIDIFDFKLSDDDFRALSNLKTRKRLFTFEFIDNHPDYPY